MPDATRSDPDHALPYWNFFAHAREDGLWCAVPQAAPLPRFLLAGSWSFRAGGQPFYACAPHYLEPRVALHGARLNGFYLYHCIDA